MGKSERIGFQQAAAGGNGNGGDPVAVNTRGIATWLFDDFLGANLSNPEIFPGWTDTLNGGSTLSTWVGSTTQNIIGAMRLAANNGNLTVTNFSKNLRVLGAGDLAVIEWRFVWDGTRPSAGGPGYIRFDMYDNAQNFYRFELLNAGNWFVEGDEGGVNRFRNDTGIVAVADTPMRFRIEADNDQVRFYIDEVLVHTHAVALGVLNNNYFYSRITMNHTTVANMEIFWDWVLMYCDTLSTDRIP